MAKSPGGKINGRPRGGVVGSNKPVKKASNGGGIRGGQGKRTAKSAGSASSGTGGGG